MNVYKKDSSSVADLLLTCVDSNEETKGDTVEIEGARGRREKIFGGHGKILLSEIEIEKKSLEGEEKKEKKKDGTKDWKSGKVNGGWKISQLG